MSVSVADPHKGMPVSVAGDPVDSANAAVVMLHGRGGGAGDILDLARFLPARGVAFLAPQASGNTWYPYSFLMPIEQNEPWLSSALSTVGSLVDRVVQSGLPTERIVLLGFSQGACLASEFVARNARRYGGLIAFSGGVIGPDGTPRDYPGSLDGTPVFLGCSDVDPHVPLARVEETAAVMEQLQGSVDMRIYPGMSHSINSDELSAVHELISTLASSDISRAEW
jgi:predicted esterase